MKKKYVQDIITASDLRRSYYIAPQEFMRRRNFCLLLHDSKTAMRNYIMMSHDIITASDLRCSYYIAPQEFMRRRNFCLLLHDSKTAMRNYIMMSHDIITASDLRRSYYIAKFIENRYRIVRGWSNAGNE